MGGDDRGQLEEVRRGKGWRIDVEEEVVFAWEGVRGPGLRRS